jgi:hypothetical protein
MTAGGALTAQDFCRGCEVRIFEGDVHVRVEPFAAVELDLSALWVR